MSATDTSLFLVEDDRDLRELLKDLLESEGYAVTTAFDGLDALSKLNSATTKPSLIVLDWMMPRLDGAGFCSQKNGIPHLSSIPVIVLTADGHLNEKVEQVGAVLGIAKPVDIELLLSAVQKYMN